MNTGHLIAALIVKKLQHDLTAEEKMILDEWLDASDANRLFFERITWDDIHAQLQALWPPDESSMRRKLTIYVNRQQQLARREERGPLTLERISTPILIFALILAFFVAW